MSYQLDYDAVVPTRALKMLILEFNLFFFNLLIFFFEKKVAKLWMKTNKDSLRPIDEKERVSIWFFNKKKKHSVYRLRNTVLCVVLSWYYKVLTE